MTVVRRGRRDRRRRTTARSVARRPTGPHRPVAPVPSRRGPRRRGVLPRPRRRTRSPPASRAAPAASPATGCGSSPAWSSDATAATRVAATWTPHAERGRGLPRVRRDRPRASLPVTWAALDCIGGWAGDLSERPMVLGTHDRPRPTRLPVVGEEHVVVGPRRAAARAARTYTAADALRRPPARGRRRPSTSGSRSTRRCSTDPRPAQEAGPMPDLNDPNPSSADQPWWRDAVIYQVYVRSFADSDGDGVGDLPGITSRLPYLRDLGVDALWITPFYTSPQHDHGYDVADYRDVDPLFGTLADADALLARAHELGLQGDRRPGAQPHLERARVVPGRAGRRPGQPRAGPLPVPRRPRPDGAEPPNNWQSVFGGAAWTRCPTASGTSTSSTPPSPTSTGATPRSATCSRTSCGSGSTAASTASGSTSPTGWSRRRACATRCVDDGRADASRRTGAAAWSSGPAATSRCGTSPRSTTSTAAGTGCSPSTTATGWPWPRRGPRPRSRWRRYVRADEMQPGLQLRLAAGRAGRPRRSPRSITGTLDGARRGAARSRPGC